VLAVVAGQLVVDARRVMARRPTDSRLITVIDARPDEVWADLRDIASHAEWMQDAEAIHFTSSSTEGVGTRFVCDTRVGPIRLSDPMEVTEWSEGTAMAIRHGGVVKGTGRFLIEPTGDGRTRLVWEEQLHLPWYMGGPLGSSAALAVMRRIWTRNLANLKHRLES
jgi:carbon monoxide dehydrogenase subunit G